jgi:hypothetical protein
MAAEHGPDPRGKLAPGEGLGHIVIGTKPEPDRPVDIAVLGGEHDHRHIRPLAQAPAPSRRVRRGALSEKLILIRLISDIKSVK